MAVEAEDLAARLRAEFPHALRTGQLVAYYQPEVELFSGRVVAAESLARWEHPEFGTLPPALFTPVAEQLGLMGELTRLMLRLSLGQHRAWAAAGWPVDELKLDMSLVRPIASNPSFRTIVRTTVDLAHQLGVKVVAEGIESEAVRSELQALGCDFGQGFLLGRPMAPGAFADWMRQREQPRRPIPAQAGGSAAEVARGDRGSLGRAVRWLRRVIDP